MKNWFFLFCLSLLYSPVRLNAQSEEPFQPAGKPELDFFANFNSAFSGGVNVNKFEITRAYLGYSYQFAKTLTGRVTYDVGNPLAGRFEMTALLKFAYLKYQRNKVTISGGMIPTIQFDLSERKWGYRYVARPFHDLYDFGSISDLGISLSYKMNQLATTEAILVNGEGNKQMDKDSALKAGIGLILYPIKNLLIRVYYDRMKKGSNNQQGFSLVGSFGNEKFNLNAEYNLQKDHKLVSGQDYGGYSFNGTLLLRKRMKIFARYDILKSVKINSAIIPWNFSNDGNLYLAGIEFSPAEGIRISPNYQGWHPRDRNKPFISRFSLNLEVKL